MRQADPTQPAELLRKKRNVLRRGDRMLTASGILLAAVSALFPWYVFLNQEKFGIRTTSFEHMRDLPPTAPRNVMSVSPLAMIDSTEDEPVLPPQPFPGKSGFRLLHVSNGRALIEDRSGMYMVRIGSILPDNSKLATIEQRDGRWVIITSSGQVYEDAAAARP